MWARARAQYCGLPDSPTLGVQDGDLYYVDSDFVTPITYPVLELGGDNVEATLGWAQFDASGSTVISGLPHKPHIMLFGQNYAPPNTVSDRVEGYYINWGAADRDLNQWTGRCYQAWFFSAGASNWYEDKCLINVSVASVEDDGFTLTNTVDLGGYWFAYMSIYLGEDGQATVGAFSKATSTGAQDITGFGFDPGAVMLSSANAVAAPEDNLKPSGYWGAISDDGGMCWSGFERTDGSTRVPWGSGKTFESVGYYHYDNIDQANADPSFIADGFRLDWTLNTDARATRIGYIAIGGVDEEWETSERQCPNAVVSGQSCYQFQATLTTASADSAHPAADQYNFNWGFASSPTNNAAFVIYGGGYEAQTERCNTDTDFLAFGDSASITALARLYCDANPGEFPIPTVAAHQRIFGWRAVIDDNALEVVEVFLSPQGSET